MRAALCFLLLTLASALCPAIVSAHTVEIASLRLTEVRQGHFRVSWELRPNTDLLEGLQPVFPEHCAYSEPDLECGAKGLVGRLGYERLGAGQTAAMFKIRNLKGETHVYTLTPSQPSVRVSPSFDASSWAGMSQIGLAYLQIGVEHIMLGVDHLLFVLGLIWVARSGWMLFKTITAFTLAHTVTLTAVTFGWVGVPEAYVNAMIALSIVFIGVEVLNARAGRETLTLRYPWGVSFFFGLLHGFGFANALIQLGLPQDAVPLALLSFNVGVEIGQIGFVFCVLALGWCCRVMQVTWPTWSRIAPAYLIGGLAALWFIQRVDILLEF